MLSRGRRTPDGFLKAAALIFVLMAGCTTHRNKDDFAAQYDQSRLLLQKGAFDSAGQLVSQAEREARRRGSADWAIAFEVLDAERLLSLNQREEAVRRLERIEAPAARPDIIARRDSALASGLCGEAHVLEPARAAEQFRRADGLLEEGARAAAEAGPELQGEVDHRRASCFSRRNELSEAEQADLGVVELARAHGLRFLEGSALVNLSYFAWRTRHYEQGAAYARDSLPIARELGSTYLLIKGLGNLGLCYSALGDYDSALEYLKKGESIAPDRQFREDTRILLQNIGNVNYFLRNYSGAVEYYKRALPFASEKKPRAQLLANLSAVATERHDFDTAEKYNAEALRLKRELTDPDSADSLKRSEVLNARILLGKGDLRASQAEFLRLARSQAPEDVMVDSHAGLADVYRQSGREQESKREYQTAIRIVENSRDALQLDESRITFLAGVWELYDNYIGMLASDGRVNEALAAADQSRAATLAQRIERPNLPGHRERASDSRALARATRSILLSYWLGEDRSYLWVSTGSRVEQFELPARRVLEDLVDKYQRIIERPRDALRGEGAELGVGLWNRLIGPAAKLIPTGSRVIIVPDRGLHRLNFETLIAPTPIQHYWIDDVTISEAPALRALRTAAAEREGNSILLMGDPVQTDRDFPELSHAADEISGIEQYYPAADRTVLTRSEATPEGYLDSDPRQFRFIHLAAHATANRIRPLDSAVVLAKARGEYKLFAREVLKVPLSAELVTISGCRSAGARAYAGEGLVGFTWAFLSAGAHNEIAGLWNVDDRSTAKLMVELHRELRLGRPPAEALRKAKLALMQNGVYERPFYWAPFLLYTRDGKE
jgi:CHAT domain-containing protein